MKLIAQARASWHFPHVARLIYSSVVTESSLMESGAQSHLKKYRDNHARYSGSSGQ